MSTKGRRSRLGFNSNFSGFTIVESLIFLAVSGAMLIVGFSFFSGSANRNQFVLSMREVEVFFQDVVNDVSAGFYPTESVKCSYDPSIPPTFRVLGPLDSKEQGTNTECMTIGKVVLLKPKLSGVTGDATKIALATVAGNRRFQDGSVFREAATYPEAKPTTVYETDSTPVDVTSVYHIRYQAKVKNANILNPADTTKKMTYPAGSATIDPCPSGIPAPSCPATIYGMGFYGSLARYSAGSSTNVQSGGQHVIMQPHNLRSGNNSQADLKNCVQNVSPADSTPADPCFSYWPAGAPWVICFESADGRQTALLTIEGSGVTLKTKLELKSCQ